MSLYATDSNGKLHKIAGNGIGDISAVDAQLDSKSTNPVQNKVLYEPVSFAEEERVLSTKNLWDTYTMSNKQFKNTVFTTWGRYRIRLKNNNSDGSILEINTTVGHGLYGVHTFKTKDAPVSFALQLSGLKKNTEYTITLLNFYQATGVDSLIFCNKQLTNFGEDTTHVATFTTNAQGTYVFENGIVINSSNAQVSLGDIMLEEGGVFTKYVVPMGRTVHELDMINFKEENKPDTELSNTSTKPVQNKVLYAPVSFAESERLKSKNLFNYKDLTNFLYGITSNGDGSFSINTQFYYPQANINLSLKKGVSYTYSLNVNSYSDTGNSYISAEIVLISPEDIQTVTIGTSNIGRVSKTFVPNYDVESIEVRFIRKNNNTSTLTAIVSNIQLEEGTVATDYQSYNGAIVHEKDVAIKENLFDIDSSISLESSTLTTLEEYFDLFNLNKSATYYGQIGNLDTTKIKDVLGNPIGFGNYTRCVIKLEIQGGKPFERRTAYKAIALDSSSQKVAIGYIWKSYNDVVYFTGWDVIGG